MRPRRLTRVQRRILALLRQRNQLSYDDIVAAVGCDRKTAIQAMKILEQSYQVVKIPGRGSRPNRYLTTDRLLLWQ